LLENANKVGIIVGEAIEIGEMTRVLCDFGDHVGFPDLTNLVAFPAKRAMGDE
jgi:hypothetical protein